MWKEQNRAEEKTMVSTTPNSGYWIKKQENIKAQYFCGRRVTQNTIRGRTRHATPFSVANANSITLSFSRYAFGRSGVFRISYFIFVHDLNVRNDNDMVDTPLPYSIRYWWGGDDACVCV